jgi:stearoyl-CoA desaturase (Delta-9 desaturase)
VNFAVALIAGLLVTQLAIFATTVYLHRGLAHKALTVDTRAALFFRFVLWVTTGMRPREWVAVHRRHHAATDTDEDPHSPLRMGFWRVQLANAALYRAVARDRVNTQRYARDLPADRWDKLFFDHAFFGLGVGITILTVGLFAVGFPWWTGLLGSGFHAVLYLMLAGAVNAVGHTAGRRPYENSATNGQALALVTAGEGLHNNHHAAPTSAKFALDRGQVDPGWWLIRLLVRFHLASVRHDEVKLKQAA